MSAVKYVSRHEEASAGSGSFAQQGGLIALHQFVLVEPPIICHQCGSNKTTGGP